MRIPHTSLQAADAKPHEAIQAIRDLLASSAASPDAAVPQSSVTCVPAEAPDHAEPDPVQSWTVVAAGTLQADDNSAPPAAA